MIAEEKTEGKFEEKIRNGRKVKKEEEKR